MTVRVPVEASALLNSSHAIKTLDVLFGKPIVAIDIFRIRKLDDTIIEFPRYTLLYQKDENGIWRFDGSVPREGEDPIIIRSSFDPATKVYEVNGEYFERLVSRIYVE